MKSSTSPSKLTPYFVYVLTCADSTFYTGVTTELARRLKEHNTSLRGAKYTKVRRPVILTYHETYENRSLAQKREAEIKKMTRSEKELLVTSFPGV
jgi:putative endonuclease